MLISADSSASAIRFRRLDERRRDGQGSAGAVGSVLEVLVVALRLGLTSFGGPVAHLGYFREEYVGRRRWLDEATFADLVALSQFLPGPASSKLGISIGVLRAGPLGGMASWLGFTLPSAMALVLFAFGTGQLGPEAAGWLHGLKVVAVAVVGLAVWNMARTLAPDRVRATIAVGAAVVAIAWPNALTQILMIVAGGAIGYVALRRTTQERASTVAIPLDRRWAVAGGALFIGLLVGLPVLRAVTGSQAVATADTFYRAGALVFGGGHVVLPLLQAEVVPGWMSQEAFLAGYGAAQAIPGPLFTFAAYVGMAMTPEPNGLAGAMLALMAIFLPAFLLTMVALPSWDAWRGRADVQGVLRGVNASVVGILLAALYDPVATSAILEPTDAALALVALGLLTIWKLPAWLVVLVTAAGGALLAAA
jgi:chromate transporter